MSLRGPATINIWADDVPAAVAWYADLLRVQPYFQRPGPDGRLAYAEFRIGDAQTELGIIDRRYAPPDSPDEPGGAIVHWHVDDLDATCAQLLGRGARVHEPVMPRGEGFVTASVVDPFGNVLGVMHNPHYLEVLAARTAQQAERASASRTDQRRPQDPPSPRWPRRAVGASQQQSRSARSDWARER